MGLFVVLYLSLLSHAAEPELSDSQVCAVLKGFGGNLEILNSTRTSLKEVALNTPVECGSWITVSKGWAKFLHRDGYEFQVGKWSFIQLQDPKSFGEAILLFRGLMLANIDEGKGTLKVLTANARAHMLVGKSILIYQQKNEETELIALENSAMIENRFQISRPILVKEGEVSTLNFKVKRLVPSLPKAVALASAKEKFFELSIEEGDQFWFLKHILKRQERKFASSLLEPRANRKIASSHSYIRHPSLNEDEKAMIHHMVRKNVASDASGEKMLFPEKAARQARSIQVQVQEMQDQVLSKEELVERKHLIEELSQIQAE